MQYLAYRNLIEFSPHSRSRTIKEKVNLRFHRTSQILHKSNTRVYKLTNYGNPTLWVESAPVAQCAVHTSQTLLNWCFSVVQLQSLATAPWCHNYCTCILNNKITVHCSHNDSSVLTIYHVQCPYKQTFSKETDGTCMPRPCIPGFPLSICTLRINGVLCI